MQAIKTLSDRLPMALLNALTINLQTSLQNLLQLAPWRRRLILIAADGLVIPLAIWLSFALRLAQPWTLPMERSFWLFPAALLLGLPLLIATHQYRGLTRYAGLRSLYQLAQRMALLVLILVITGVMLHLPMPPRSSWPLLWLVLTGLSGTLRFSLRELLLTVALRPRLLRKQLRVAIYGAGLAGAQLLSSLSLANRRRVVVMVDDNPSLWRRSMDGVPIRSPQVLKGLANAGSLDEILLAIPSLSRDRLRHIVEQLQNLNLPVLQVPSVEEITSGRTSISSLRPIAIEELLGRDPVPADPELLSQGISGRCVLVTGAGGSIGTELTRLILRLGARALVLLEISEPSLYTIDLELRHALPDGMELHCILGSACDEILVEQLCRDHHIDIIFHAAAYKHVPMVELNPLQGLSNNVGSTRALCSVALRLGIERMILISTDKAVRPTSVMGASKRLAEMVMQATAQEAIRQRLPTCFTMVRFGNVLGSSGSVVPLFRHQIEAGGPITLTHPDIIRYFMTISEAAELVVQAAILSHGGDVFLLEMGEPVRIEDLARQMIRLSGLSVRDETHPDGDIAIIHTGLRPGEKLYEELLITAQAEPTAHPRIYRAQEKAIAIDDIWLRLRAMETALSRRETSRALAILAELVPEWQQSPSLIRPSCSRLSLSP